MVSVLALCLATVRFVPIDVTVMTYNIRYATAPDGENAWPKRKDALISLVKKHDPDILGVQEALAVQIDALQAALPTHSMIGVGRDDGVRKGEYSAIFYRRDMFGVREGGTRWISETPSQPGSLGPGANIPRVFSWGEFFTQDGFRFLVLCAHLDHQSPEARLMGTRQMRTFADQRTDLPTLVIGDFNCTFGDSPLDELQREDRFKPAKPEKGPMGTFNGFDPNATNGAMIDHVFVSPQWVVQQAEIDRTTDNGHVPSDHFPLVVRLKSK